MNDERLSIETDLLTPFDLRQSLEIWPLKYWFIYFIIMIFFLLMSKLDKKALSHLLLSLETNGGEHDGAVVGHNWLR